MLRVVESDESPHTMTANLIAGTPIDLVKKEEKLFGHLTDQTELRKGREMHIPEIYGFSRFVPRNMTLRQAGKRANHGFNYDLGYRTFSIKYGMVKADAKRVRLAYRQAYGLERWHGAIVDELRSNRRTLYNCFGRKYRFMGNMNDELFKAAYSFKPQSSIADQVNRAIIAVWNERDLGAWEFLLQVHDSIVYQHPIPTNEEEMKRLVYDIEGIADTLLREPLEANGKRFFVDTEVKVSLTDWAHMHEVYRTGRMDMPAKLEAILCPEDSMTG